MIPDYAMQIKEYLKNELKMASPAMVGACLELIDYLSICPERKKYLQFAPLYKELQKEVPDETFYNAVFFLTREDIDVLNQKFEAYNPNTDEYENVNSEDVLEAIRTQEYYNPITGDILSLEEFGEQVLTYFSTSPSFESKINAQ